MLDRLLRMLDRLLENGSLISHIESLLKYLNVILHLRHKTVSRHDAVVACFDRTYLTLSLQFRIGPSACPAFRELIALLGVLIPLTKSEVREVNPIVLSPNGKRTETICCRRIHQRCS